MSKRRVGYLAVLGGLAVAAASSWWHAFRAGAGDAVLFVAVASSFLVIMMVVGLAVDSLDAVLWPHGVRSRDHRGQRIWLRDPKRMPTSFNLDRESDRLIATWMRANPLPISEWVQPELVSVAIAIALPFAVWLVWPFNSWVFLAMTVLIGSFIMRPVNIVLLRWRAGAIAAIGRCPSCGYELAQLPIEPDGCVVCPECGAAWRRMEQPSS
jgi:hypothetical protein